MSPVIRQFSTRSFMRLSERSSVDLPQPDGPMNAVISFSLISRLISCRGVKIAVMQIHIVNFDLIFHVHSPFISWSAFSLPERKAYSSAGPPAAERLR